MTHTIEKTDNVGVDGTPIERHTYTKDNKTVIEFKPEGWEPPVLLGQAPSVRPNGIRNHDYRQHTGEYLPSDYKQQLRKDRAKANRRALEDLKADRMPFSEKDLVQFKTVEEKKAWCKKQDEIASATLGRDVTKIGKKRK